MFGLSPYERLVRALNKRDAAKAEKILREHAIPVSDLHQDKVGKLVKVSALSYAIRYHMTGVVSALIKSGVDVNREDWFGDTPLIAAARKGHKDIVKILLKAGANPDIKGWRGDTALGVALECNEAEIAALLQPPAPPAKRSFPAISYKDLFQGDHNMFFHNYPKELLEAAKTGDYKKIKQILRKKPALVNTKNNHDSTLLSLAVWYGHATAMQVLTMDFSADVDLKDKDGDTPLMNAILQKHEKIATFLIAWKTPDFRQIGSSKYPLLIDAIRQGMPETAIALIAVGAPIDAVDSNGSTALMWAAQNGETDIVKTLIEKGALLDERGAGGNTALAFASQQGHREVISLLLAAGADKYFKNNADQAPAQIAESGGHTEAARLLYGTSQRPVIATATPAAPAIEQASEKWALSGDQKIACTSVLPDMGIKLMDIFNFEARERITVTEDLKTGVKTPAPPVSFGQTSRAAIEKALKEFKAQGGKIENEETLLPRKGVTL